MTKQSKLIISTTYIILVLIASGLYFRHQKQTLTVDTSSPSQSSVDRTILDLENKIAKNSKKSSLYINLANLYLQKIRETADIVYYSKIDSLMDRAIGEEPSNSDIFATQASVSLGRHDFQKALSLAEKSISLNPNRAIYFGLLADAQVELGQYEQAIVTLQKMVDTRPDYNSFSRIAYLREINGDIEGAKKAINQAISAGSPYPENLAWAYVELGKLQLSSNIDEARKSFNFALQAYPKYAPAYEALGRIAFAGNNSQQAIPYLEKAFAILPIAQYATSLGDIYFKTGDQARAHQHYALAKTAYAKSSSSGINTDLEFALFLADHDMDLPLSLEKSKSAYLLRPNIFAASTLAWAYYKNGNFANAQKYITEALKLGEHDARILFYASKIAEKNNHAKQSESYLQKSRKINPYFSILYQ